jgi:hypothetical protein
MAAVSSSGSCQGGGCSLSLPFNNTPKAQQRGTDLPLRVAIQLCAAGPPLRARLRLAQVQRDGALRRRLPRCTLGIAKHITRCTQRLLRTCTWRPRKRAGGRLKRALQLVCQ